MELNDPFEFLGAHLQDRDLRTAMRKMKWALSKNRGLIRFSGRWRNPLLWSHYADRHRGVCLSFDVPDHFLGRVEYARDRISDFPIIDEALVRRLLLTKFAHWSYESEYRLFVALEDEEKDGNYFTDFSEDLVLKKVIVGCESSITRDQVSSALGELRDSVDAFKARPAFTKFRIVQNKKTSLWK